jgi:[acyl-carrier-protein] S-malonyltransferase
MAIAHVFPGQGSQYVGMGKDLYEAYPEVKELYLKANEILGYDIAAISFEGPEDKLKQTYITQPAILIHSIAASKLVKGKDAQFAAGHSLGEFSALIAAGALSFEDALKLVKLRGELMQKAGEENEGTMAAVIGLDAAKIEEACKEASAEGIVQVANYNSPGQIVISGSVSGVQRAMALAKEKGAKLVKQLVVHGAFHSPLMESARPEFKAALNDVEFKKLRIPVYANITAKPFAADASGDKLRENLYNQLTSSVRWDESVVNMINDGADEFIELGPGKVLQGLIKRIDQKVKISGVDKAADVNTINNQQ